MKKFNDLKISTRLNIATNFLFFLILVPLALFTISLQKKQLIADTETRMFEQVNDLADLLEQHNSHNREITRNALTFFAHTTFDSGVITPTDQYIQVVAENQISKDIQNISLKSLDINGTGLYNHTFLVDQVAKTSGTDCTILQKIPQGYLRISSSALKNDGNRGINTYIPSNSPIAIALDNNEEYIDRTLVSNQSYLTAYKAFTLNDGSKIVLASGMPEKELSSIKDVFNGKKYFDTGYPFLVDNLGNVIIHPQIEGSNVKDTEIFKQVVANRDGYGSSMYEWEGSTKQLFFRFIPEIDS